MECGKSNNQNAIIKFAGCNGFLTYECHKFYFYINMQKSIRIFHMHMAREIVMHIMLLL